MKQVFKLCPDRSLYLEFCILNCGIIDSIATIAIDVSVCSRFEVISPRKSQAYLLCVLCVGALPAENKSQSFHRLNHSLNLCQIGGH